MDINLQKKIHLWSEIAESLRVLKQDEIELRKEITEALFSDGKLGVNNHDLGHGYTLKCTLKETTSVDAAALAESDIPDSIKDVVFKFDPKLIAAGYKSLDKKDQKLVDSVLIVKPAPPALSLVAPKKEDN